MMAYSVPAVHHQVLLVSVVEIAIVGKINLVYYDCSDLCMTSLRAKSICIDHLSDEFF